VTPTDFVIIDLILGAITSNSQSSVVILCYTFHSYITEMASTNPLFLCDICAEGFTYAFTLARHKLEKHSADKGGFHKCETCKKLFARRDGYNRHVASCIAVTGHAAGAAPEPENIQAGEGTPAQVPSKPSCSKCGRVYIRVGSLKRHETTCVPKEFKCQLCPAVFNKMTLLYNHRREVHAGKTVAKSKSSLGKKRKKSQEIDNGAKRQQVENRTPVRKDTANLVVDPEDFEESLIFPPTLDKDEHEVKLKETFESNWGYIRSHSHLGRIQDRHVIRLASTDLREIHAQLRQMFKNQRTMFRINLSFGWIMRHKETGNLRYWHASHGEDRLFDYPAMIRNAKDFEMFLENLEMEDILEWTHLQRPDTKWVVDMVTNCVVFITKIHGKPII